MAIKGTGARGRGSPPDGLRLRAGAELWHGSGGRGGSGSGPAGDAAHRLTYHPRCDSVSVAAGGKAFSGGGSGGEVGLAPRHLNNHLKSCYGTGMLTVVRA